MGGKQNGRPRAERLIAADFEFSQPPIFARLDFVGSGCFHLSGIANS
jgi:hypothetical protein